MSAIRIMDETGLYAMKRLFNDVVRVERPGLLSDLAQNGLNLIGEVERLRRPYSKTPAPRYEITEADLEPIARQIALAVDLDPDDVRLGYPAWRIPWILESARKGLTDFVKRHSGEG